MADTNGNYNSKRLDRIEGILKVVVGTRAVIKNHYRSQVDVNRMIIRLAKSRSELDIALKEMARAQKQANEHMDTLRRTADEILRGRKYE